jgi:hypothetical protein
VIRSYLHISKLRECFVTAVQDANKGLEALMGLQMGTKVAALSKVAITLVTRKRTLACVTAPVSFQVTKLRERKITARKVADLNMLVKSLVQRWF